MLSLYSVDAQFLPKGFRGAAERNILDQLGVFSRGYLLQNPLPPDPPLIFIKGLGNLLPSWLGNPHPYPQSYPQESK